MFNQNLTNQAVRSGTNKMKNKPIKAIAATMMTALAIAIGINSCKKDDKVEPLTVSTTTGSDVIDATIGSTVPATTGIYYLDKAHSNVMWETEYMNNGNAALLTGRFNLFNMFVKFDQANPANTTVSAWVQLSTFNTGESGRDAAGKCGPTYMGVQWTIDTVPNPDVYTVIETTDTAWFTSASCAKYGDGYLVKGSLNFKGVTSSVDMYMDYQGKYTTTNATTGKKVDRAGIEAWFMMKAVSVFGVTSTSISDDVKVRIDWNARTKEY